MTLGSALACLRRRTRHGSQPVLAGLAGLLALLMPAWADAPYPFEGAWVRNPATCTPATVRERVYTAKEVISPRGRCMIRRVAAGYGAYELLEECRRTNERPTTVTETIRLTSPDSMVLKRQLSRLKIPRQIHYVRCKVAASPATPVPGVKPGRPAATAPDSKARDPDRDHDGPK